MLGDSIMLISYSYMGEIKILVFLLLLFSYYLLVVVASTANEDYYALLAIKNDQWQNTPPNWVGSDPCGGRWEGIACSNSRVTSLSLASMGLSGQLSSNIALLSELQILDLSYNKNLAGPLPGKIGNLKKLTHLVLINCGFTGPIPKTIGNLERLVFLSLNSNRFSGRIPPAIGNLTDLYWLDLAENQLDGPIPISNGSTPGLDMLHKTKHFHFGENKLSGNIPAQLFSSEMALIHVLFESNQLTGSIPSTLGLVKNLKVVRFDGNFLSGHLPVNINNLTKVRELFLSNNRLSGPLPNLTRMNVLYYLDMSNNSFDRSDFPPWLSTLQSLKTIMMENTQLQGPIPVSLFNLVQLQKVVLKDNQLNGTLDIGTTVSDQLGLLDLQHNSIEKFNTETDVSKVEIKLVNNPVCQESGVVGNYCSIAKSTDSYYTTPPNNCVPVACSSNQILSPNCKCAYPYTGNLTLGAPSFSDLGNKTVFANLELNLMQSFRLNDKPVDSVSLSNPRKNAYQYLDLTLMVFPSGQDYFNRTGISGIGFLLSHTMYKPPPEMKGPFFFIADEYDHYMNDSGELFGHNKKKSTIVGVSSCLGSITLLGCLWLMYKVVRKKILKKCKEKFFKRNGGLLLQQRMSSGEVNVDKTILFTLTGLKKATDNFNMNRVLGKGGQGTVYKGMLADGRIVAVKKFKVEGKIEEFINEFVILSQINNRNVVKLLGCCLETEIPLLVYEFIPNGNLFEYLHGQNEDLPMTWDMRLRIATEIAGALYYLHSIASHPIYHRDVKTTNIMLDEKYRAKLADFGASRIISIEATHLTTVVQGTFGYLDPEYFHTSQFTEKSDVYSFGVVLGELLTGHKPISSIGSGEYQNLASYFVHCMEENILFDIIDKRWTKEGEKEHIIAVANLAQRCLELNGRKRPTMKEAMLELEGIRGLDRKTNAQPNNEEIELLGIEE